MKLKTVLAAATLLVVLAGSYFLYNALKDTAQLPDLLGAYQPIGAGQAAAQGASQDVDQDVAQGASQDVGHGASQDATPDDGPAYGEASGADPADADPAASPEVADEAVAATAAAEETTEASAEDGMDAAAAEPSDAAANAEAGNTDAASERIAAPDFTVQDAEGNDIKLSDMAGKPVVLNFWASWCPPCKSEMPEFNKVFGEVGSDVHFMMVDAVDGGRETKAKGSAYVEQEGFAFPVYYDMEQDASTQYGIRAIPTTLFIDADGYIAGGVEGAIDEETLRRGIDLIMAS